MKNLILLSFVVFTIMISSAQTIFPQQKINAALNNSTKQIPFVKTLPINNSVPQVLSSPYQMLNHVLQYQTQGLKLHSQDAVLNNDTLVVGDVPSDTVIITGLWTHTGPIWVLNDGVLIFDNATVIDTGDIYVFGNGQLLADSTSFFFPQEYFYQRSFFVLQNGYALISNSSFNYSGYSHNLLLADSSIVIFDNIHQNDFTTCGLFGAPTLSINNCNLTGEYILTSSCTTNFTNCDTLLLWHHFPDSAIINFDFPDGDTVTNYSLNNNTPGISGIGYTVFADSCHTVWWGMMPVNGSDVTISNSVMRTIGAWFQYGDTVNVTGLFDNSYYSNFIAPLPDRNLHLINTSVQTWSLYVFDSSMIAISNCELGEVGTQQHSTCNANDFLLDGSGGYFWATDTSFIVSTGATVYSTTRSERNGIFLLAYSWLPFAAPSAIGSSVMICAQNKLVLDPVAYDQAIAWMQNIALPDTGIVDSSVVVTGSVWIDNGPAGSWMDFGTYSLFYQKVGTAQWTPIVLDSLNEVRNASIGIWNTNGLTPGNYLLRLLVKNNFGDSIESIKPVYLAPSLLSISMNLKFLPATVFPNPTDGQFYFEIYANRNSDIEITIRNIPGEQVLSSRHKIINGRNIISVDAIISPGAYIYELRSETDLITGRLVVQPLH